MRAVRQRRPIGLYFQADLHLVKRAVDHIAHDGDILAQFHNCDEVISYIHQNYDSDYGKEKDHYMRLKDKIPNAISHAQQLAHNQRQHSDRPASILNGNNKHICPDSTNCILNPYTDVHLIFESLLAKGFIIEF